ncbi:MAG: pyruvate, phosphate dikinase [Desulfotomaculales bacterium]
MRYVYMFHEGRGDMKELLGGKGANLAEMTNLGLPVPSGFIITTAACKEYYRQGRRLPAGLEDEVRDKLRVLEERMGRRFGDPAHPLLVSVRSGAPVSMPGMMDTVLNLGLNDETVAGLARLTGDMRFALDCYRRFFQMFGNVVLGVPHDRFEEILERHKEQRGIRLDHELTAEDWREIVAAYKGVVPEFPSDPMEQLFMAIRAVFDSWFNDRAVVYRRVHKIPEDLGTAVNVQVMVFGNLDEKSGTGVAFTRNPATGENRLYGEYLLNAQGEDVVAGIRTPRPLEDLAREMPDVYRQFEEICRTLERHYREMQDVEFTIERGKLYILQTRKGKRTAEASVKIAVDMVHEGLITREEALLRVDAEQVGHLLHRRIDPRAEVEVIARGLPASPGAAVGEVVFDADTAEKLGQGGRQVILVRTETTPDDIHGIVAAQGVLTSRGGMTSHAAVVARGMGKPCVCGCEAVRIDPFHGRFYVGDLVVRAGDTISIDGSTGRVIKGAVPLVDPELTPEFRELLSWADQVRTMEVRANADTPADAAKALEFGAEGIGLCRTEHMFMGPDRLPVMQAIILAETPEERNAALARLLPLQEEDFYAILKTMAGLPVTIRLLDPPLHEFLPDSETLTAEITELRCRGDGDELAAKEELLRKVRALKEFNPMLGHRGCRLGITSPEIYAMQARAIFRATVRLIREGYAVAPEIEIPLVADAAELGILREVVSHVARQVHRETGVPFSFTVGTMIELPRACLLADEIAREASFFSFGTNDLTQTTLGISRDDAQGRFIPVYVERKILPEDPFIVLDRRGVGKLMRMAVELGRAARPELVVGLCGEHGGDPESIAFCHEVGMDYVSCSPYRVPVARLAAAQARLRSAPPAAVRRVA